MSSSTKYRSWTLPRLRDGFVGETDATCYRASAATSVVHGNVPTEDQGFTVVTSKKRRSPPSSPTPPRSSKAALVATASSPGPPTPAKLAFYAEAVRRADDGTSAADADIVPVQPARRDLRRVPDVVVVGTSLVRGLGKQWAKRGIDATCYIYPGCEIPFIRDRLPSIFTEDYHPPNVVLQCGGNDAEGRSPHAIVQLVNELQRLCPASNVTLNLIPVHGNDPCTLEKIDKINTYICNRDKKGGKIKCSDPCSSDRQHLRRDLVHFNEEGVWVFATRMANHLRHQLPRRPRFFWVRLQS